MAHLPYPESERFATHDHIIRIQGWNEPVADAHLLIYRRLMFGPSPLGADVRQAIGVAVSQANGCHY